MYRALLRPATLLPRGSRRGALRLCIEIHSRRGDKGVLRSGCAALAAGAEGPVGSAGADGGSAFMMFTGGIEAADGKNTSGPGSLIPALGTTADAELPEAGDDDPAIEGFPVGQLAAQRAT